MNEELLQLFAEHLEKQDMLSKLTENEKLHNLGYSEIHTIVAIADLENPNVTAIADYMHMTKGAISKIIKKLTLDDYVEAYQNPDNQQKIFYRLKKKGKFLYTEHQKRHELWKERDNAFFLQCDKVQLEQVTEFMKNFNQYLETKILELGGIEDVN